MTTLRISGQGVSIEATADRQWTVGRSQEADLRVDDPNVSRQHLDVVHVEGRWTVTDTSSRGTYVAGEKVESVVVDGPVVVALGGIDGPTVEFHPVAPDSAGSFEEADAPGVLGVPAVDPPAYAGTVPLDDTALRLELDGVPMNAMPGTRVVVGRREGCMLRTDDELVSGEHCAFEHDGKDWILNDLGSTRGTYVDGRRISGDYTVRGSFTVGLGDPSAGTPLRVVTAGTHRKPADVRTIALAGAVGVIAVVLAILVFSGDGTPNDADQLADAKRGTVLVADATGTGSGAFVAPNLILTNRHVAEVSDWFLVGVTETPDEPVTFRYEAVAVAAHPFLDLAVLEITTEVEFDPSTGQWDTLDILTPPPVVLEVGSSEEIGVGDEVQAFGFPALTTVLGGSGMFLTSPVTASRGDVVNFRVWPGCDNPDASDLLVEGGSSSGCSPDGDITRGSFLSDGLSGSGGSGGPVVVDGEIVGVIYAVGNTSQGAASGGTVLAMPSELFADWLRGVIDEFAGS